MRRYIGIQDIGILNIENAMQRFMILFGLLLVCLPAIAAPDGAKLYARNCAGCHGEKGDGGIGIPLSLPSFHATVDDDYLKQTLLRGRPGRVMPSFSHLSDAEVNAIVPKIRDQQQPKLVSFPCRL